jgi:hypothetical protein
VYFWWPERAGFVSASTKRLDGDPRGTKAVHLDDDHDATLISPELALVSPELAERARALLPPPGTPFWRDRVRPEPAPVLELPLRERESEPASVEPRADRRKVLMWTAERFVPSMVAGALAVVATVLLTMVADAVRPGVKSSAATTELAPARKAAPEKARVAVPVGRVLRWRAKPGAAFYDVQVYHGAEKVLEAWPAVARLDLPRRWTFGAKTHRLEAGMYRWYAWPAYFVNRKPRYGTQIVRATFIVRAGAALSP